MPATKLGDPNAKAKCGRCQQVFLLNDHLVLPDDPNKKKAGINLDALNAISDDVPLEPKRRTKREKPVPTGDVIFDDMDGTESASKSVKVAFSDNELDSFLNSDVSLHNPQPMASTLDEQKSQQDDEAWVRDLLDDSKESGTSNIKSRHYSPQPAGVDFDNFIPVAAPPPKKNVALNRILADKDPTAQDIASRTPFAVTLMWLAGCALLVGLLVAQYVFFNIATLAKNPIHAGTLKGVCAVVRCTVPSTDLSAITIEHTHDNKDYTTNIIINLKNTSDTPVLFPNLLVTVKDVNGQILGDFIATNTDYVSESQISILSNQNKRIMLTVHTVKFVSTIDVRPFY